MQNRKVSFIVKTAMLSAMSVVLMLLEFPILPAVNFLKLSASDVPALVGGFLLGPISAVAIVVVKVLLFLITRGSDTGGIGELSKLIIGLAFVLPSSLIYLRHKGIKSAILGLVVGCAFMILTAHVSNYFVVLPLYGVTGAVKDSMMPWIALFNLISGFVNILITFLIYKQIGKLMKEF